MLGEAGPVFASWAGRMRVESMLWKLIVPGTQCFRRALLENSKTVRKMVGIHELEQFEFPSTVSRPLLWWCFMLSDVLRWSINTCSTYKQILKWEFENSMIYLKRLLRAFSHNKTKMYICNKISKIVKR